jgi:hypothetical protein
MGGVVAGSDALAAKPTPKDAKVNAYVEIINSWSNYVFENRARYAGWVADMKAGPTCKELHISAPSAVGDSAPETYKGYRKALGKKPKLDADDAALQMVTALEEMIKPVSDASEYYHGHAHLEDGCKRGKELHPVLLAAWAKYEEADRTVRAFVEKANDERQATELASAQKKYGKALHYYHLKLPMDGKVLVRAVEAAKADVGPVREALTAFSQTLTEVTAVVAKEKQGKNSEALYEGGYEQLVTRAGWFKDAVESLLKATGQDDRSRAGKQVIGAYNDMIDQSNKTMFSKSMK